MELPIAPGILSIGGKYMTKKITPKATNGEGSWGTKTIKGTEYQVYRKYYNGKRKEFYGKTKAEAKKKCKAYESSIVVSDEKVFKRMCLEDYMQFWLYNKFRGEVSPRTFDDKEQIMNSHIIGTPVGYMQMGAIDTEMIQEMLYEKAETYSLSTCRKIYFILDQMFTYAVRKEERYNNNPMEKVDNVTEKRVKQKPKDEPFLEESDMQKLIVEVDRVNTLENRINGDVGTRVYGVNADLALMLLYTGARSEEGLALQFKDFVERDGKTLVHFQHVIKDIVLRDNEGKPVLNANGQKTYIQVDSPEMKSEGSKRFVPLNDEALELLNRIRNSRPDHKPTDYLFITENGTLPDPKNVRRTLKNMLTRANCDVTEMGLHGLRRSFATYLINKDVPLVIISELLGHSNVIITQKQYAKVLQAKKAEGIDLMQFKTAKKIPTVAKDVTANHNVISITDFHKEKRHIVL